jgi:ABC-type transport system involved in multi-copper enzyme maturation permease subunit
VCHTWSVVIVLAVVLAALFGAGDQYLGSFSMHPWMADVSLLSAPWLVVGFLAGYTQRDPKRAVLLGLLCTFSALVGYGLMTLSPVENAQISGPAIAGFIRSQSRVIVGGIVTGPLFGWFGHRWRVDRAWLGALATGAAFCLEPLAHNLTGLPIRSSTVLWGEVAVGVAIAVYIVGQLATASRTANGRPST